MFWKRKRTEVYSAEEMGRIEKHIATHFGAYENVFHELVSPDLHIDIACIPPFEDNDYHTLVTIGMGAHSMNVPKELRGQGWSRAELLITLPPEWKIESKEEVWYWPIRQLKTLARMPGAQRTWLCAGHTVSNQKPFADGTDLSGMLLMSSVAFGEESVLCEMPQGDPVRFFQLIPLYNEEIQFKLAHGVDAFLELLPEDFEHVVDIHRKNYANAN
jgi:hypothetical protein